MDIDPKMVHLLNKALADEHMAIAQYMHHYNQVRTKYDGIVEHFLEHMNDEIRHANELTARIFALKGKPTSEIQGWAEYTEDVNVAMQQDIDGEADAIELYSKIMAYADKVGDEATLMMIEAILDDERKHLDEFTKMLGD